jgi:hypothetical protein
MLSSVCIGCYLPGRGSISVAHDSHRGATRFPGNQDPEVSGAMDAFAPFYVRPTISYCGDSKLRSQAEYNGPSETVAGDTEYRLGSTGNVPCRSRRRAELICIGRTSVARKTMECRIC